MSYDLRICVKAEGCDIYPVVNVPEYDAPTYNLGEMFRVCMDWDYEQGKYYPCDYALPKIECGIVELKAFPEKYKRYESPNGWGDISGALEALESLRKCILDTTEYIPLSCLFMRW